MDQAEQEREPSASQPWWRRHTRLLGLVVGLPCWAVLAVAISLQADPRGFDTHTQLGLPACGFLQRQGLPCPTCGMTTAFTLMAHGHPLRALWAQPYGAVLSLLTALAGLLAAMQVVSGRAILLKLQPRAWWLWVLLGGLVAGWALRLAMGLATGEYPVH